MTNKALMNISFGNTNLVEINLGACESISDEGIHELVKHCGKNLRVIHLEECAIGDESVIAIAQNCAQLETLNLSYCKEIGSSSLETLGRLCRNIKQIDFSYCKNLSIFCINQFIAQLPKLRCK